MTRVHVAVPLRWSDFDAYAHVNNAEMLHLLEEARIQTFWHPDDGRTGPATAIMDARPGASNVTMIAQQQVEYLLPIPYMRAPVDIEVWIGRMGGASFDVCYEVYSPAGVEPRQFYTRALTTVVLVSTETNKPMRVSAEQRAAWEPFVEATVQFTKRG